MTTVRAEHELAVLHVVNFTTVGGVEAYVPALFAELGRRGHRNVVLADGQELASPAPAGTVVHRLPGLEQLGADDGRRLVGLAKRAMAANSVDVAFLHGWMNPDLASFIVRALPTVFFAHNFGVFCPSGSLLYQRTDRVCQLSGVPNWRCLANAYLEQCNTRRPGPLLRSYRRAQSQKRLLGFVDGVVCDSEYVRKRLIDNGVSDQSVSVLPSPAPRSSFWDGQADREPIVLFVGRITPHKGLAYLLRAMASVSQSARLVVAGDGYGLPEMRRLAGELEIAERTDFLGVVGHDEVNALYRRASVLAVPSVWPEPWGMVGPEAMASGMPVVGFRSGGIPEWLTDGQTGFLVEPRDVDGLAARIDQLLGDPELAHRLGSAGRATAQARFTAELHADRLIAVFRNVIERRARAGLSPVATS